MENSIAISLIFLLCTLSSSVYGSRADDLPCCQFGSVFLLRGGVDTSQCVQAAGITDVGQTLGNDFDQERLVISYPHIGGGMAG